jgi:hypothetical protein
MDYDCFEVIVLYEGYESENAYFDPLVPEQHQVSVCREVIGKSIGKSVRQRQPYAYTKRFYRDQVERMAPEHVVKLLIADTIKEAEDYEFNRWFKVDGRCVFEETTRSYERETYQPFRQYIGRQFR